MFNPSQLTLARKRRGLTKTRLAQIVRVDVRSISAYEDGDYEPSKETLGTLAIALRFPKRFFFNDTIDTPTTEAASFRSLSKRTAGQRDAALAAGALAFYLNEWIDQRFTLPDVNIPRFEHIDPEGAAIATRQYMGVGELPIRNVIRLLEAHGVRIYALGDIAIEVDAFSMWRNEFPFIFLNTSKSAERSRFDCGHELGHLILHRQGSPEGRKAEDEANAFASAFLMPQRGLEGSLPALVTLPALLKLKSHWGVSAFAMAYRLNRIEALSDWHYRTMCIELAKLGYRKSEPDGSMRETSAVLEQVTNELRKHGQGIYGLAEELALSQREINGLMVGLTKVALDGGNQQPTKSRRPPTLKVVK